VPRADACPAAKSLAGKRFLSSASPRLPLTGCTAATCTCHYRHHSDRRIGRRDGAANGNGASHPRRRADDFVTG
jgi:hypothetical protein